MSYNESEEFFKDCISKFERFEEIDLSDEKYLIYKSDLQWAYDQKTDLLFTNSGREHAVVLLSTIFDNTKDTLYIYGRELRKELTSCKRYVLSLFDCIKRGVSIKVLLEEEKDESKKSPMRKVLEELSKKECNVSVRSMKNVDEEMKRHMPNATHFTVSDNRAFRMEYDIANYKAFCSMNSSEMSEYLISAFNATFSAAHKS